MRAWPRLVLALLLGLALPAAPAAAGPPPPKLIIVIAVDQFSSELFDRYRDRFASGLQQLAGGIAFAKGYQSHAATETCPGHSTILTGRHPAATGIVSNVWFDVKTGSYVYCVGVAGTGDPDARGPQNLRVDTFGDWLKAAEPGARVVSVSGKDRAAIMLAGHHPDAVYWWRDGRGFGTSSFAGPAGPDVTGPADTFNASVFDGWRKASPPLWPDAVPPDCAPLEAPHVFGTKPVSGRVPPDASRDVETGPDFLARTDFQDQLRASPLFDRVTLDFAAQLIGLRQLGRGPATDVLAVSLSATDYVGHRYGNGGAEMCANLHALDDALGRFLGNLASSGVPFMVVLTADHGAVDAAEREAEQGVPARRIDAIALVKALNDYLKQAFAIGYDPIVGDDPEQLVINAPGDAAFHARLRDAAIAWLKTRPEVNAVFPADEIVRAVPAPGKTPDQLTLAERFHESYDADRSGDIIVALSEYATLGVPRGPTDGVAGHGSPWDYDRQVPILFWWPGIAPASLPDPVETVDIAPTLAGVAGIAAPPVDGRCLVKVSSSCGPDVPAQPK